MARTFGILENDTGLWTMVYESEQGGSDVVLLVSYQGLPHLSVT